jgi:predicted membrane protein
MPESSLPGTPASGPGAKRKALLPEWARQAFVVLPTTLRRAMPWTYWIATIVGVVAGSWIDWRLACALVVPAHRVLRLAIALILPVGFIGAYLASLVACGGRLMWQKRRRS